MQLYRMNAKQRRMAGVGVLGLGMLVAGVAPAHAQFVGGFQSNTSGAIVMHSSTAVSDLGGDVSLTGTQGLLSASAGLSATDLRSSSACIATTFPDSTQRQEFERALDKAAGDIDALKSNIQDAVPSEDTVNSIALSSAAEASTRVRNSLLSLVQATAALPRSGSAEQDACIQDVFNAIDKAVTSLEQTVPEIKSTLDQVNSLR